MKKKFLLNKIGNDKTNKLTQKSNQKSDKKYSKSVYRSLILITQFGLSMLVPIFMCTFLGIFIDQKAGTSFWVIILFFAGALAGANNIYKFAKSIYDHKPGADEDSAANRGRKIDK